jgi:hypothetical protein
MDDIVSELTRVAFQESYVKYYTLTKISDDFDKAGVVLQDIPTGKQVYGERRTLVEKYYSSVDWTLPPDVQKVLKAYQKYLLYLFKMKEKDELQSLIRFLEEDGLRYSRGEIELPTAAPTSSTPSQTPAVEETATPAAKPLSARDLGDRRRVLLRLLDAVDQQEGRPARESVAGRIGRLRHASVIPRQVAACMRTITEMRNVAEYEAKTLSAAETEAVAASWVVIKDWALAQDIFFPGLEE